MTRKSSWCCINDPKRYIMGQILSHAAEQAEAECLVGIERDVINDWQRDLTFN